MAYTIKQIEVDEQSLLEVARFLKESFPKAKKFTSDFIRWQYAENPIGTMLGFNAWEDEKIVSHFAGLPIEMSLYGEIRKGLLCINVATNEKYRGQKLFTKLGNKTAEYAQKNGFDFLIAVPNANSTHGFLKYFGFYLISPLDVRLGVGTNIYDDRNYYCYKTWDEAMLKWRISNPANKYYCDCRADEIISTPISILFKTISRNRLKNAENVSLKKIMFRPFNLYIGLGADMTRGFYMKMPSFIKRPPFNVVFRDLTGGDIPKVTKENLFLQLIDLDTI